ncbi:Peptidase family M48 [Hyella patelloides LEGE 07179]|uniref:Peptidase family M48 n=1 Tax=Hyella patelloides LEGE 07179 TaxID=945734 RepID=A0A563VJ18_9CYAN|nr:M48 family metallopeptidase [Hyella patelloides]VEP11440.1 Peptidase family M48 [Hyella patelloides LEGE 07179]
MLRRFSLFNLFHPRRRWLYGLFSLVLGFAIAISSVTIVRAASWIELLIQGAQIIQLSSISDKQEVELGSQINQELIDSGQAKIYRNQAITNYVNRIGQELAKKSERPDITYTFQVVDNKAVNAFATMGGYVYIHTGLMQKAENEAELASVIGHEIGHIVGRHSVEQMKQRAISQGILSAAGLDRTQAVQLGVELAVNRRNSRQDELEADRFGLDNLTKADYAPSAMVSFMKKLLEGGNSVPTFLSTHPATSERIKLLEANISEQSANAGKGLDRQAYQNQISAL